MTAAGKYTIPSYLLIDTSYTSDGSPKYDNFSSLAYSSFVSSLNPAHIMYATSCFASGRATSIGMTINTVFLVSNIATVKNTPAITNNPSTMILIRTFLLCLFMYPCCPFSISSSIYLWSGCRAMSACSPYIYFINLISKL